jgi:regulatory protein
MDETAQTRVSGTITALTAQKRRRDRVNVFLDGEFALGLDLEAAAGLKVGQTLSWEEVQALGRRDAYSKAKDAALRLLTHRPRSVAEVRRHLNGKKFTEATVDEVIERLESVGLLNDREFAAYWIDQRETFRPRSHVALRHELRQKGVGPEVIDQALLSIDETDSARRAAAMKALRWARLPEEEFRHKLGRYLQRRGFRYGTIRQIIDEQWQAVVEGQANDSQATI